MTAIHLAELFASIAVCTSAGLGWTFRAWRRSDALSASRSNQVAELTATLSENAGAVTKLSEENKTLVERNASLENELKRYRNFVDQLEPRFVELGGAAGEAQADARFWQEKAIGFLAELKGRDAQEGFEALMEFLSRVTHHPNPARCP